MHSQMVLTKWKNYVLYLKNGFIQRFYFAPCFSRGFRGNKYEALLSDDVLALSNGVIVFPLFLVVFVKMNRKYDKVYLLGEMF